MTANPVSKKKAEVAGEWCVACGSCLKTCPRAAIRVPKGICAEVDGDACVGCGICRKICPASAIDITVKADREDCVA